ncbi:glycosyltransferase family 2 protein [Eilatimonas milleporae]|uniref:Glycosyl transferase family 2 n=1 Tax=Eilatimonas milleporae TaxID=911205 RepID=A0A3M0C747_9PROT|nr:glycosyltransferase family 2 protein [Eilatimonas milleporae]RMB04517.1 glycosyl transferase family 2 [Eilatimonas milleporae]
MDISFITPFFNSHDYLGAALDSVRRHCGPSYEMIVVDDASRDRSYIDQLGDDVRVILSDVNMGPGGARNLGLEAATGDYIFFLDSDDVITADPVAFLNAIETAGGVKTGPVDMVHGQFADRTVAPRLAALPMPRRTTLALEPVLVKLHGFYTNLYRRVFLKEADIRFPAHMRFAEDLSFLIKSLARAETIVVADIPIYRYNRYYGQRWTGDPRAKPYNELHRQCRVRHFPKQVAQALVEHPVALKIRMTMVFKQTLWVAYRTLTTLSDEAYQECVDCLEWVARSHLAEANGMLVDIRNEYGIPWDDELEGLLKTCLKGDRSALPPSLRAKFDLPEGEVKP